MLVSFCLHFWLVFHFLSNPLFIRQFTCFLQWVHSLIPYPCGITCTVRSWGGVSWVTLRHSWLCAQFCASAWFNVPTRCPIPSPSPAPYPVGDWGVKLRGSYASTILQLRLRFDRLSIPASVKWFCPFLLPWFDLVAWVRPGLPYLACRRQKGQTEKIVSVDRGSAYGAYPYLLFPTDPEAPPSAHICRYPCQRFQVWRQWWLQPVNPINLGSWRHPASPSPCHSPDGSPSLILYNPYVIRFRRVLLLRWSPIERGKGFCHALCCDAQRPGPLCYS